MANPWEQEYNVIEAPTDTTSQGSAPWEASYNVVDTPPAANNNEIAAAQAATDSVSEMVANDEGVKANPSDSSNSPLVQVEAFNAALAQGLSLGYSDEITAGVQSAWDTATSFLTGSDKGDGYAKRKAALQASNSKLQELYPKTYLAGEVAGQVGSSLAVPTANLFKGAGTAARLGNTAITEGLIGGVAASGESNASGVDLLTDTAKGFGIGAIGGVAGDALGSTIKAVSKLPIASNLIGGSFDAQASNAIKAEIRKDLAAQGIEVNDSLVDTAFKEIETLSAGGKASIADSSLASGVAADANRVVTPSSELTDPLAARQSQLAQDAANIASPTAVAGDTVGGRTITEADLTPSAAGGSTVSSSRFADNTVKAASNEADPYYRASYATDFDKADIADLNKSPTFKKYLKKGKASAKDDVIATGGTGEASLFQSLDETQRAMGEAIGDETISNTNKRRIGLMRDQLLSKMDSVSPDFAQARQITKDSFNTRDNVALGRNIFKTTDADELGAIYAKAEANPAVREELLLGAQETMKANIAKGVRGKNGKLISDADITSYNNLVNGSAAPTDLTDILNAEGIAARTAKLADTTPKAADTSGIIFKYLKGAGFSDAATATAVYSLFADPTLVGAAILGAKFGVNRVAKRNRKELAKATQNQLYKLGATKADVKNILLGDFEKVPADRLAAIGKGVSNVVARQTTQEVNE